MKVDTNGHHKAIHLQRAPARVVSLVPSLTESLFDLGLGEAVVGITDYCAHPADRVKDLPTIGGPKNPRLEDIIELKPDLVLANKEENTRQAVEALEVAGIPVLVTFPQTVRQAVDVLWMLVGVFRSQEAAARLQTLEVSLQWVEGALPERQKRRYFCPIWQGEAKNDDPWWMTFNQHTYIHDLLRMFGGENVFAERLRRYPLQADLGLDAPEKAEGRDVRYPRVSLAEVREAAPEMIILPDEPFSFKDIHKEALEALLTETPAVKEGRIFLVDGSLLSWHGTRLGRALQALPGLFAD